MHALAALALLSASAAPALGVSQRKADAKVELFKWMRPQQNAAVGNARRMTVDAGVTPGTFRYVGSSGVSAQQLYLGTETTLYVVDKTERNDNLTINGHPAWAAEIDLTTMAIRPLDIVTNSFCAGGAVSGNGSLVNVGGNNAITTSGADVNTAGLGDAYGDQAGGKILRVMDPCNDGTCNWVEWPDMTVNRWYPSLETLSNGTVMIAGGELYGGYTNLANQNQNNPTIQIWPYGPMVNSPFLARTQPNNLFPILFNLPDGQVFMQAGYSTIAYNPATLVETPLGDLPRAIRLYPASGATAMLPMTPANNYTASMLFCGGVEAPNTAAAWDNTRFNVSSYVGSQSCSRMDYSGAGSQWYADDDLLEGRIMGQFVNLPDGTLFLLNGCSHGTAGYGWAPNWIAGQQGYGSGPILSPAIYNPSKPAGLRWTRDGLGNAAYARMYHSSAMLLPDGSVLVAGSNPNADFIGVTTAGVRVNATDTFWTTYGMEKFYPPYYNNPRPQPQGIPSQLSYGGSYFNVTLPSGSFNSSAQLSTAKFILIRTSFNTHGVAMGQRMIELQSSLTANSDGSATMHVAGIPSPNIVPPGPLLAFVVIGGTPSIGAMVMAGSGQLGQQTVAAAQTLPVSSGLLPSDPISGTTGASSTSSTSHKSGASSTAGASTIAVLFALAALLL